jgi:putative ABC transport system ATP-binding protein
MAPLIQLDRVSKTYGSGDLEVHALRQVSLSINIGEYCAIMGPSGSGKSTAMNLIGCLDQPSEGEYLLDGEPVATLDDDELADIRNRKIGFVFQQFHLLPQLNALENVMLPMAYAGISRPEREDLAEEALTRVGLQKRLQNRPHQLSGGQQQRVAIARAIINQPVLLLADEPTGALDSRTSQEVMEIFKALNEARMTIVMVTHNAEVARQSQRVVWFSDGEVVHNHLHPTELGTLVS